MPTGLERQGAVQNNTLRHARFPRPKFDKPKLSKTRALFKSDEMTLGSGLSGTCVLESALSNGLLDKTVFLNNVFSLGFRFQPLG